MNLAILETGAPPPGLQPHHGDYPGMFDTLLGGPFARYNVSALQFPERARDHDAYLITGSSAGVYDDLHWIEPLKGFLRSAAGEAKLVGVCFGHQIMAESFGGKVIKSPKGWGVGLNVYDVRSVEPWMEARPTIAAPASHQDQVVEQPPASRVTLASDFTPFAGLAYADHPSISFQFHPEFDPAYAAALIEARRGTRHTDDQADAAIESLSRPNDRAVVGEWIRRFLTA